jgi:metal-dependent HD superfamily phosphatase/phosphodiesterase
MSGIKLSKENRMEFILYKKISLEQIKSNYEIRTLIKAANDNLEHMGYTEHGLRHVGFVSNTTANMLKELGYDDRTVELGAIAGWMHDIGNAINRKCHSQTGSTLSYSILRRLDMDISEIVTILGAIGNHEEEDGIPVNPVSAAVIIADKSDAHRTRVRRNSPRAALNDIHDRVNLSIKKNSLIVDKDAKIIRLILIMDQSSTPMEYMQTYLTRMIMCENAAAFLGCVFELVINDVIINHHKKPPQKEIVLYEGQKEVSEE